MVSRRSVEPGARAKSGGRFAAVAAVLAFVALAGVSCGGDDFEKTAEGFNIEPASEVGPHAFTPSVAAEDTESAMGVVAEGGELAAAEGAACDTDKFLEELQKRPDAYREWARVLGIAQAEVPDFVRGLKTAVLPTDTKVTNHGLKDGKAYPRQSVLTAGTAVLVDEGASGVEPSTTSSSMPAATAPEGGVIVTRCKCGNPLLPAGDPGKTDGEETPSTETPGTGTSAPGTVPPASTRSSTTSQGSTTSAATSSTVRSTTSSASTGGTAAGGAEEE